MLDKLKGYRTYFCAIVIAIATALQYLGYITEAQFQAIVGFVGAGAIYFGRAALKDASNPVGKNE